jgi:phosphatidylserine decarboxylase
VTIARDGWPVIGTAAGVLGLVGAVGTLAGHPAALVPLALAVGFGLWFFRDPERVAPEGERLVLSPADGRVVAVAADRALDAPATRVSIFMSPLDVHVNRNPVSGTVVDVLHTAGSSARRSPTRRRSTTSATRWSSRAAGVGT